MALKYISKRRIPRWLQNIFEQAELHFEETGQIQIFVKIVK